MNKIKFYRNKKGLTQVELAGLAHISVGYLCHLEKGTRTNPSFVLDKSISEIFLL